MEIEIYYDTHLTQTSIHINFENNAHYNQACNTVFLILNPSFIFAQVTIDSNVEPKAGAILDLKENGVKDANSSRGLLFPRLVLTNLKSLADIDGADNDAPELYRGLKEKLS